MCNMKMTDGADKDKQRWDLVDIWNLVVYLGLISDQTGRYQLSRYLSELKEKCNDALSSLKKTRKTTSSKMEYTLSDKKPQVPKKPSIIQEPWQLLDKLLNEIHLNESGIFSQFGNFNRLTSCLPKINRRQKTILKAQENSKKNTSECSNQSEGDDEEKDVALDAAKNADANIKSSQMRDELKFDEVHRWTICSNGRECKSGQKKYNISSITSLDENQKIERDADPSFQDTKIEDISLFQHDLSNKSRVKLIEDEETSFYEQKSEKTDSSNNTDDYPDTQDLSLIHTSYGSNNLYDENSILKEKSNQATPEEDAEDSESNEIYRQESEKQHVIEQENITDQEKTEEDRAMVFDKKERKQDTKTQEILEHKQKVTLETEVKDDYTKIDYIPNSTTRDVSYSAIQKVKELATIHLEERKERNSDIPVEECLNQLTKAVTLCKELTDVKCEMNMDSRRVVDSFQKYKRAIGQLSDFVVSLMDLKISERFGCQKFHLEKETLMELALAIPYGGEEDMKKVFMQAMAARMMNVETVQPIMPERNHSGCVIDDRTICPDDNISQEDFSNLPVNNGSHIAQPEEDVGNLNQVQDNVPETDRAQATGEQTVETEEHFVNYLLSRILSVLLAVLQTIASQFNVSENADRLERYLRECWNSFEELCGNMRQLAAESLAAAEVQRDKYPLSESRDIILEVGKECLQICLTQLAQQLFHPLDRSVMTAMESSIAAMRDAIERKGWQKNKASTLQTNSHPMQDIRGEHLTRNRTETDSILCPTETHLHHPGNELEESENNIASYKEASFQSGQPAIVVSGCEQSEANVPTSTLNSIPPLLDQIRSTRPSSEDTGYGSESTPSDAGIAISSNSSQSRGSSNSEDDMQNTVRENYPEPMAPESENSDMSDVDDTI